MVLEVADVFVHLCIKKSSYSQKGFDRLINLWWYTIFWFDLNLKLWVFENFRLQNWLMRFSQVRRQIYINKLVNCMSNTDVYSAVDFHVYPLELFILLLGFLIGFIIATLNDRKQRGQQNQSLTTSHESIPRPITYQSSHQAETPEQLILSYSLSTGQSFEVNGKRHKLFKGHLYTYLPLEFTQNQQGFPTSYEISKSCITKTLKDGQWIKLYNPLTRVPKNGKFYFNIFVTKNEYFVKRQGSQKAISNVAVSRTDIIFGFLLAKEQSNIIKLSQELDAISHQSERETNSIQGITAYGFNGKIYNNGDLRTEEKIVKKNKTFTVLVNRDQGFVAYELEGETVGFSILPKDRPEIIPFVEMFAIGSSIIISS